MTPTRFERIKQMLIQRQTDLTVLMEEVHKPHNVAALIRTCDAVGIHAAHVVWNQNYSLRVGTSLGAHHWVGMHEHSDIETAIAHLKGQGMQVLVTNLSDDAVDCREVDYTLPTAIILGQEKFGATKNAIALADKEIVVPMVGMTVSLNVSVAAAVILYEAQRQREAAGMYETMTLPEAECQRQLFAGGYPQLYQQCRKLGLELPQINDEGDIEADDAWWHAVRQSPVETSDPSTS